MQRALLQYNRPENRPLIEKAIALSGRHDAAPALLGRNYSKQNAPNKNTRIAGNKNKPSATMPRALFVF
jgi:hypothetical protein